jgi:hypothetical protein
MQTSNAFSSTSSSSATSFRVSLLAAVAAAAAAAADPVVLGGQKQGLGKVLLAAASESRVMGEQREMGRAQQLTM